MFGNTFKSTKKQLISVRAWVLVIVISMVLFTLLGLMGMPNSDPIKRHHDEMYANFSVRMENLSAQLEAHCEAFHVVTFGSSLLASAVTQDTFFNRRFQQQGKPITVTRIFQPGAVYSMLEDPILNNFLEKFQPDLLCIEDQSFFLEPINGIIRSRSQWSKIHRNYVFNLNRMKHFLLPQIFSEPATIRKTDNPIIVDSSLTFDIDHAVLDSIIPQQDSLDFEIRMRKVRNWRASSRFNKLVQTLAEKGTTVAVINVPRPEQIEKAYLLKRERSKRERLIRKYQQKTNFEYWPFESAFPFRYYWDTRHVNKYGRKIYSDWLLERIDQHYEKQGR